MPIGAERFDHGETEGSIEHRIRDRIYDTHERAYSVLAVSVEVMDLGLSERTVEPPPTSRCSWSNSSMSRP